MLVYFIILILPIISVLANFSKSRKYNPIFWIYFIILLFFCGFRLEVGPDWHQYHAIYQSYSSIDFSDFVNFSEPGFFLISKVSELFGTGYEGVIFFCSLIFLLGCFFYARTTADPWLAIAAILPYLVFIISMSGIRQSVAIGLGFYLFANWNVFSITVKLIIIALATSFHNSAALLLIFVIYTLKVSLLARGLLTAVVVTFVYYALDETDTLQRYQSVYLEQNIISTGAFYHVLLTTFPALLYLIFQKKLIAYRQDNMNVYLASWMALAAMPLLMISSTGISRVTLYLSFVQMWVYPAIIRARVADRLLLRSAISILIMAIFFVYFIFGVHASAYLPYQNIFFQ